ncbi:IS30 family transposase [Kocuria sp. M4R2S49]|uniref:IS30 family transposase n=1 Tax=Kocuria rhizosphaericola TaxID=3376284 RepID=UPI0037AB646E
MEMGIRGRKRRLVLEDEYWALILSGVGTVEACRMVGIGRKTGYRWRAELGGLGPARRAEAQQSERYLSLLERERIAVLRRQGLSMRAIAARLGRAPSTVSRELRRNTAAHDRGGYDPVLAHARARTAARRHRPGVLAHDEELRRVVQSKLELDWSPQQIAVWLRTECPQRPEWHVCHETIYQALYHGTRRGLHRRLTARLRTGRSMRQRRRRPDQRTPRFIAPGMLIDQRPAVVEERVRIGDWEGDLIVGAKGRSAIGTLVDRTSRYVRLVHLPNGHAAQALTDALEALVEHLPQPARRTLTWDQGSEMARHDLVAAWFSEGVYFAAPASPWMRGSNENMNGLLRQYFPKGTDLSVHTAGDLTRVEQLLNTRPRKVLGWATPATVFTAKLSC